MLPPEWIHQPKWIKRVIINFFNHDAKNCCLICNPDVFSIRLYQVKKLIFIPEMTMLQYTYIHV